MESVRKPEVPISQVTLQQKANSDHSLGTTLYIPEWGGYKETFVLPVESKYKCEKCHHVLCNPRQTECGHRLCETCINAVLSSIRPQCPACEMLISKDKVIFSPYSVFRDTCCKREVLSLKVYCRNKDRGCKEEVTLGNLSGHLTEDCQYEELTCPRTGCKEKVFRKDLSDHIEKSCKYRDAICKYCKGQVPFLDLQKHEENECLSVLVPCPHKCNIKPVLRSELHNHLSECNNAPSTCNFKRFGCTFKGTNQQIKAHETNSVVQHVNLMKDSQSVLEAQVTRLQNEVQEKSKSLQIVGNQLCEHELELSKCREYMRNMESRLFRLEKVTESQAEKFKEFEKELRQLRINLEETNNTKGTVEALQSRVTQLENASKNLAHGTRSTAMLEAELSRHDQTLSVHSIRLADMDLRFQVLETASYSGTLIWKIRDYKRRKQEAVLGKTLSLYSQPFYTGYFGYKMCARVYLNGDGMGKGTHLSLFFVVMRGEYDALLPWPFKQKVTLMLLDQGSTRRHLGDAFKPDPNSSSFKRPTGEMNIASGCPLFVAQTVLESGPYIKDDTIFIKVIVDTSDLPDP
ncbi:TNF receptor-associated factor 3 isoform X1 [Latimeria chalumnae]|uniref:TNF receptor-associated factor 3 isoform X1 n=1 Tax=Latimeria chalumnae TaxID=7897 RepID=UPI00313D40AC